MRGRSLGGGAGAAAAAPPPGAGGGGAETHGWGGGPPPPPPSPLFDTNLLEDGRLDALDAVEYCRESHQGHTRLREAKDEANLC